MKNLLFGAAVLFLMASCAGNGRSEKVGEDSSQRADSSLQTEVAAEAETEQVPQDSMAKDANAKTEKTSNKSAEYDDLLNQYEKSVKNYQKFVKTFREFNNDGFYHKQPSYTKKCRDLYFKINKIKNNLTPEQNRKFKSLRSKYEKAYHTVNE